MCLFKEKRAFVDERAWNEPPRLRSRFGGNDVRYATLPERATRRSHSRDVIRRESSRHRSSRDIAVREVRPLAVKELRGGHGYNFREVAPRYRDNNDDVLYRRTYKKTETRRL